MGRAVAVRRLQRIFDVALGREREPVDRHGRDLINAAIDTLIRERCELPLLTTLDTLAGTAHRFVNAAQWQQVYERLSAPDIHGLDALLTTNEETQESPFAVTCRGAGKPTRENLKGLIAHYQWLETLVDPAPLLAPISEAKVAQWANEAQRLKAHGSYANTWGHGMRYCLQRCGRPAADCSMT